MFRKRVNRCHHNMAAPAPARFDSDQALYIAMNETIAKVAGKHTVTRITQPIDEARHLHGPYSHFMMACILNNPRHIKMQVSVPNAIGAQLEGGTTAGNHTLWKKSVFGPAELEESVNNYLNILAFAKMAHEQQVRAAQAAQAAQAAMAAMAALPREP